MKSLVVWMSLIIILFMHSTVLAGEKKRPYMDLYEIVSDTYEDGLARGVCVVEGNVVDQSGAVVQGATIARVDNSRKVTSDKNGHYQIKLTHRDSVIYMFHPKYGEIVIRPYDFKGKHRVILNFYPINKNQTQTVKKPVIYCYGRTGDEFELRVRHPAITFAYPALNDCWKVRIQNNGSLLELNSGKEVPYLFWEGQSLGLEPIKQHDGTIPGFVVSSDSLTTFFESALNRLGFNSKESTDFITFWAPEMQKYSFVFIQFWIDQEADRIAALQVTPEPASLRRVYMIYQGFETMPDFANMVVPQNLESFDRETTSILEWGGCELASPVLPN